MADISSINGVSSGSISKVNEVDYSTITSINGIITELTYIFGSSLIGEKVITDDDSQSMSGCCVSDDQSILLVCGSYADEIYVLSGSNINDYVRDYTQAMTSAYHNALRGMHFSPDGSTLFITSTETGNNFTSQPMSTPYDLTTLGATTRINIGRQSYSPTFNSDGTFCGINNRDSSLGVPSRLFIYSLSTPYDITTILEVGSIDIGDSVDYNAVITPDGKYIFVINRATNEFEVITLTADWSPSISTREVFLTLDTNSEQYQGMYCKTNGLHYDVYFTDSNYSGMNIVRQIRITRFTSAVNTLYATIDSTYVDSTLTNHPVKISFDNADGFLNGRTSTDWQYLHITSSSAECYVEVVAWNMGLKYAVVNVLVPSISSSSSTVLEITFGTLNTATYVGEVGSAAGQTLWPSYNVVYHLHSGPEDSSTNSADGTDTLTTYSRISGVYCAEYTESTKYTTVSLALAGDYTISFLYMRGSEVLPYSAIITNNVTGDALTCIAMDDIVGSRTIAIDNNTSGDADLNLFPTWESWKWYHITVTRSGSTIEVFRDGISIGSTASGSTDTFSITHFGMRPVSATNRHDHYISEVKIIESVLSDNEIKVEANNMLGTLIDVST